MRLRRRLQELEQRVAELEARTIDYTMPPRYDIDLDPAPPITTLTYDLGYYQDTDGTGVYL
jgi:hypothetical protein